MLFEITITIRTTTCILVVINTIVFNSIGAGYCP